jgi:hypothetical protein
LVTLLKCHRVIYNFMGLKNKTKEVVSGFDTAFFIKEFKYE